MLVKNQKAWQSRSGLPFHQSLQMCDPWAQGSKSTAILLRWTSWGPRCSRTVVLFDVSEFKGWRDRKEIVLTPVEGSWVDEVWGGEVNEPNAEETNGGCKTKGVWTEQLGGAFSATESWVGGDQGVEGYNVNNRECDNNLFRVSDPVHYRWGGFPHPSSWLGS